MPPGDRALLPRAALLREASAHAPCPPSSATGTEAQVPRPRVPTLPAGVQESVLTCSAWPSQFPPVYFVAGASLCQAGAPFQLAPSRLTQSTAAGAAPG